MRIATEQFPEAVKISCAQITPKQIVITEEQLALLERVRELKSHSNFGASLGEIVAALAKEYLDRNDPLRREVKPRSMPKKSPNGNTSGVVAAQAVKEPLAEHAGGSLQGDTTVVCRSRSGSGLVHACEIRRQ